MTHPGDWRATMRRVYQGAREQYRAAPRATLISLDERVTPGSDETERLFIRQPVPAPLLDAHPEWDLPNARAAAELLPFSSDEYFDQLAVTRSSSSRTRPGPDGRTVPYPAPGVAGSTSLAQHTPVVSSPRRPNGVRRRRHSSCLATSCFRRTEGCPFGRPTDVNALLGRVVTGPFGRAVLFRPRCCAPGVGPTCEHAGGRLLRTTGIKLNPLNRSCRGPMQL